MNNTDKSYLEASHNQIKQFQSKNLKGTVVMLNMLKFREIADYSKTPNLSPEKSISGREAYKLYSQNTFPMIQKIGAEVLFSGQSDKFLIGPEDKNWDAILIVKYKCIRDFLEMTTNAEYLKGFGHRIAALEDSRLLPIVEGSFL